MFLQVREIEADKIRQAGFKPARCPQCLCRSLWPDEQIAMNSLSRDQTGKFKGVYICNACGNDEAFADITIRPKK